MTDTNSTPTPPGDSCSRAATPASQQPVPLQPTSACASQRPGHSALRRSADAIPARAGQAPGYGAQAALAPWGLSRRPVLRAFCRQVYGPAKTYEAEPVSMHAQHAAPKGNGGKTFHRLRRRARGSARLGVWGIAGDDDPGRLQLGHFVGRHRSLHGRDDGHRAERGSDVGRGGVREVPALGGCHHCVRRRFPE